MSHVPAASSSGTPLPPPPPNGYAPAHGADDGSATSPNESSAERAPRPGELVLAWRVTLTVTWVLVFLAQLAVWKTSEEIGISTWWLGPSSTPQPVFVQVIPFLIPSTFLLLTNFPTRRLPWLSLAGAAALGAIAVPDFWRAAGVAIIEVAIAGAVALVSLASMTGTYREPATADG